MNLKQKLDPKVGNKISTLFKENSENFLVISLSCLVSLVFVQVEMP